jgi:hypothetical protein
MDERRTSQECRIGDLVSEFVGRMSPVCSQYDSVAHAWASLLPEALRAHCRIAGVSNCCLKVAADGSSYMFGTAVVQAVLLRELQRVCRRRGSAGSRWAWRADERFRSRQRIKLVTFCRRRKASSDIIVELRVLY